ncbi:MAG: 2,3-bisphosphoglycerate-independent phosphoglycerate mutase [Catonella sp.]|uniref:2,3-bisphosphoglycerate-independent phosphoglycerate mutase n=1 Tax=Catonella sp. TaxID=2382125 RepID=UPI003FA0DA49
MERKILLAIADGLGDRPCDILDGKTPLEYAKTEHLNYLAEKGSTGIMDLYQAGSPVGTDLGHLILFGYSIDDYPGRGPIEAFGNGMELIGGDVAFRCNFATLDNDMKVIDRRAGRIREGTEELASALNGLEIDGVKVLFKEATEHRAVMVLRGPGLSQAVTDTDPKKEGLPVKPSLGKDNNPTSKYTAVILNKILLEAHQILSKHPVNISREKQGLLPANGILTRGAGMMPNIDKITERLNFKACCVAAESTVLGVARLAGFNILSDESFTGNIDTDIEKKASFAIEALKYNDFVALHYKATDLMGHDNDPLGKVKAIEQFDRMLGLVISSLKQEKMENVVIALAADHSTPCERKEHSGDPVPIVICGKNLRKDNVKCYDEISCANGGLNRIKGADFNRILLDYLEVTPKYGN